jgi:transposase
MKQTLTATQQQILTTIIHATTSPQRLVQRSRIILGTAQTSNQSAVAREVGVDRDRVRHWLNRWRSAQAELTRLETDHEAGTVRTSVYRQELERLLSDAPRPGAPRTFSEDQKARIIALATDTPEQVGVPVTHWSHELLATTAAAKGIVSSISPAHVGRFLKERHPATPPQPILGTSERQ